MTNPKLIFKDDKLFVVDAPEMPIIPKVYEKEEAELMVQYQETLSKAPTWGVKNKEEVFPLIMTKAEHHAFNNGKDWQPEQGKLYDMPTGYKIEEDWGPNHEYTWPDVLLIPQAEEVKGEQNNEAIEFATWYSGMQIDKVIIAYNRWKEEKHNPRFIIQSHA